jgi:HAD superfamily hydrolase (TIGR01484 family)
MGYRTRVSAVVHSTPVRLALLDLDGTMLDSAGRLTSRSRGVLQRLALGGLQIAIVTGRGEKFLRSIEQQFHPVRPAFIGLCHGGSQHVYDPGTDTYLLRGARRYLAQSATTTGIEALALAMASDGHTLRLGVERGLVPGPVHLEHGAIWPYQGDLLEQRLARHELLAHGENFKAYLLSERLGAAQLRAYAAPCFPESEFALIDAGHDILELCPAGAGKAPIAEAILAHLGLRPENVVGAGDAMVDLGFLPYVGTMIIPSNADPEFTAGVYAAGVRVIRAGHHDADGPALALASIFGG